MRARREPRAEIRQAAAGMHEVFVALIDEGFTEKQALEIVARMAAGQPKPGDEP